MKMIDLDFRPLGYGAEDRSVFSDYSNLTGEARVQAVRRILMSQPHWRQWKSRLAYEELTEVEREWLAVNQWILGLDSNELNTAPTEIAHIQLVTVHSESCSILAESTERGYRYDIEHDMGDDLPPMVMPFRESSQRLSLRQLIDIISNSYIQDDEFGDGGLVLGFWSANLGHVSVEEAVKSAWVDSVFYPQLADYFDERAVEWLSEYGDDEDEE